MSDRRQRAVTRLAIGLLALIAVLLPAGRAEAHAGLDSSYPAPSSVLPEGPASIVLEFDEPVEAGTASIELFDQDGTQLAMGEVVASAGSSATILADAPQIDDGTFAVVWRVTSIDGHVIDGAFSFQVGTASSVDAEALLDQVRSGTAADPIVERIGGVGRFLAFVGVVVLLGAGVFLLGTPARLLGGPGARRLLATGWTLAFVGTLIAFGSQAAEVIGGSTADVVDPAAWGVIDGTRTGQALIVRLVALVVVGALLVVARHRGTVWWRATAITAAVVAVISFPAGGHAAAQTPEMLWTAVDAVHLAAVVAWLGGLILLCTVGRRWGDDAEEVDGGATVVRRFSRTATVAVPVIVATGVAQTLQLAGGLDDLTSRRWGQVLLVKVAVVAVLVALGGVSRWVLHHAGPAAVRRTVLVEAVLGVGVLALVAGLVALPPQTTAEAQVFSAALTQSGLIADVTLTPGLVGGNEVHVVVTPQGGSLQPITDLTGRMRLPSRDIPAVPITFSAIGTNHYTGTITLPFEGTWTLELVVVPSPGNTLLLITDVPIG